jgi:hypothetical protein
LSEDTLIHLDGLREIAERAADAHAVGMNEELGYERFGVCTTDLRFVAESYGRRTLEMALEYGGGLREAMELQFLAGFDVGYQARLEVEAREVLNGEDNS